MEIMIGITVVSVVIVSKRTVANLFHLTNISGTNPELQSQRITLGISCRLPLLGDQHLFLASICLLFRLKSALHGQHS